MPERRGSRHIAVATAVMGLAALVLLVIAYSRGRGEHILSLKAALGEVLSSLPILAFAFVIAEAVQFVVPQVTVADWVGTGSGLKGILLGTAVGSLTSYCPVAGAFIAAAFLRAGASISTTVAFMTGLALLAFPRLPLEVGILGWRFALVRLASTFFLPVIAGLIAGVFFSRVKLDL